MHKKIEIFNRWMEIPKFSWKKSGEVKLVFVWRLVALKWAENLIEAFKNLNSPLSAFAGIPSQPRGIRNLELIVIWDWEDREKLEKLADWYNVKFLWFKDRDFIINFLQKNNVILVNPSFQEWMPTSVIEWLLTGNVVVASDVWGTKEISNKDDLILFEAGNNGDLLEKLNYALGNFNDLAWLSKEIMEKKFGWEENLKKFYEFVK